MPLTRYHVFTDAEEAFRCLLFRDDAVGASAFLLAMSEPELARVRAAARTLCALTGQRRRAADGTYTFGKGETG